MPKLFEVCRHIRSKNAGPFWITVDLFFKDSETFENYSHDSALSADTVARLFGARSHDVKIIQVPSLNVVKVSYPRPHPQGYMEERDMHAGQQYVSLLDLELRTGQARPSACGPCLDRLSKCAEPDTIGAAKVKPVSTQKKPL